MLRSIPTCVWQRAVKRIAWGSRVWGAQERGCLAPGAVGHQPMGERAQGCVGLVAFAACALCQLPSSCCARSCAWHAVHMAHGLAAWMLYLLVCVEPALSQHAALTARHLPRAIAAGHPAATAAAAAAAAAAQQAAAGGSHTAASQEAEACSGSSPKQCACQGAGGRRPASR
jgi:hypothetical protein